MQLLAVLAKIGMVVRLCQTRAVNEAVNRWNWCLSSVAAMTRLMINSGRSQKVLAEKLRTVRTVTTEPASVSDSMSTLR